MDRAGKSIASGLAPECAFEALTKGPCLQVYESALSKKLSDVDRARKFIESVLG